MLPECPDDLKYLLPFLQRAAELKSREPVIAYYTGFYAANMALLKGYSKSPENDSFLMALVNQLEQEKQGLSQQPAINDQDLAKSLILQFAMRIFLAADNEDRAGQATKKTGRLFLVASQFLEVLRVFGSVGEEVEERIKYAKWKATDIVRALNEGRQPQAGPPGNAHMERRPSETDQHDSPSSIPTSQSISPPPPITQSPPPPPPPPPITQSPPPPPPSSTFTNSPNVTSTQLGNLPSLTGQYISPNQTQINTLEVEGSTASYRLDPNVLSVAEKYARYAVSAIQFEDVPTGIQNLELALRTLQSLRK